MTDNIVREAYAEGCRALERNDFAKAVAEFGRALVADPEDPLNLHGAGVALTRLSHYDEAEKLFRRAIMSAEATLGRQNPTVATIAFGLIDLFSIQGRYDEAELICRQTLRNFKVSPVTAVRARILVRLAGLHRKQGRLKDAERAYLAAIAERTATFGGNHPKVAEILPHLAELYREMDRPIDAAETARRVLRIRYPDRKILRDAARMAERREGPVPVP